MHRRQYLNSNGGKTFAFATMDMSSKYAVKHSKMWCYIEINALCYNSDTYAAAKSYGGKKRAVQPLNYSEKSQKKRRKIARTNEETQIESMMERIRVKSERLTNLKKALCILNRENDKKEIMDVDRTRELF